jgi:hypothetical protein
LRRDSVVGFVSAAARPLPSVLPEKMLKRTASLANHEYADVLPHHHHG